MKETILILNRMDYWQYYNAEKSVIDYSKYDVVFITEKNKAKDIPSKDYLELISCDLNNEKHVLDIAKNLGEYYKFTKVLAFSERNLLLAAKIREILNISGMTYNEVLSFRNKYVMKQRLFKDGINVPKFEEITSYNDALKFLKENNKIVIKPKLGMGSANTYIIKSISELHDCFLEIENNLIDYEMEQFINGDMYHCDSLVVNGQIKLCSINKYLTSTLSFKNSKFLASVMEDDSNLKCLINAFNSSVIQALNFKNGVTHHEIFVDEKKNITFCEIAARVGGVGVNRATQQAFQINLIQSSICTELNQKVVEIKESGLLSGWLLLYPEREGVIKKINYEKILNKSWLPYYKVYAKVGDKINKAKYSSDGVAMFIVTGNSKHDLIKKINYLIEEFYIEY